MTLDVENDYTLIKGGTVVTMDDENRVIEKGAVLVKGNRIEEIGPFEDFRGKDENRFRLFDAEGCVVIPGLVNAHTHLPMSLFRGMADDLPLMVWLNEHMFPAEAAYIHPENVRTGTLLSCAEMLLSGTTCCCDGYFHEDAVAEAFETTGMRGVLAQGVIDFPAPGVPDPSMNVDAAVRFVRQWKGKNERIRPSIFCHSPYTCSAETVLKAKNAARDSGVLFQIHVSETHGERERKITETGLSPVAWLESLGVLDKGTLLVHAVAVDEKDMAVIRKSGAVVAHAPESNMKLASGVAPVPALLEKGIDAGLGTDGSASNNDLDMFGEMRSAALIHKAVSGVPTAMDAATVLRMATLGGAKVLGLDSITGSLKPGKKADLVVVDMRKPHLTPMYSPMSHLVYSVKGSDVRDVMVDGRWLVLKGTLTTIDMENVLKDAISISGEVGQRFR
jgi:5-methylthioadenosine/S-adenosylhomocysteine deaminase